MLASSSQTWKNIINNRRLAVNHQGWKKKDLREKTLIYGFFSGKKRWIKLRKEKMSHKKNKFREKVSISKIILITA